MDMIKAKLLILGFKILILNNQGLASHCSGLEGDGMFG